MGFDYLKKRKGDITYYCRLAESDRPTPICCLDGKPLVVGPCSKDRDERKVAEVLVDTVKPQGWLLADGNYDSRALYDQVSFWGGCLLTPVPPNAGKGHHRPSPARLAAILAWKGLAGYVYEDRIIIEQTFGHVTSFGGGLGPLPAWVRTLPRVRRWVGAKLILYHARPRLRRAVA